MQSHRLLARLAAAQLALNLAGFSLALRNRYAFDVPFMHGDPARIRSQAVIFGTAFSAPHLLLITHLVAVIRLIREPDLAASKVLRIIGAIYVTGYLAERRVRRSLTRTGWHPLESPLLIASLALSVAMAASAEDRFKGPTPG